MASTVSLAPEPIPLDVKIVLVGPPTLYYLLSANDEEFAELFKIAADFEDRVERTPETTLLYARLICAIGAARKAAVASTATPSPASSSRRRASPAIPTNCRPACARSSICCSEADQLAADAGKEVVGAGRGAGGDRRAVPPRRPHLSPPAGGDRPQDDPHRDRRRGGRPDQRAVGDQPRHPRLRHPDPDHRAGAARPRRGRRHRARGRSSAARCIRRAC